MDVDDPNHAFYLRMFELHVHALMGRSSELKLNHTPAASSPRDWPSRSMSVRASPQGIHSRNMQCLRKPYLQVDWKDCQAKMFE